MIYLFLIYVHSLTKRWEVVGMMQSLMVTSGISWMTWKPKLSLVISSTLHRYVFINTDQLMMITFSISIQLQLVHMTCLSLHLELRSWESWVSVHHIVLLFSVISQTISFHFPQIYSVVLVSDIMWLIIDDFASSTGIKAIMRGGPL